MQLSGLGFTIWCLTPLWTIFELYRSGQIYRWRKPSTNCKLQTHFITLCCIEYIRYLNTFDMENRKVVFCLENPIQF